MEHFNAGPAVTPPGLHIKLEEIHMNGFIDEVCTQGTRMQEAIRYYQGEGLAAVEAAVEAYRARGCERVLLSGMGSSLYAMDAVRSLLTGGGIPALAFSAFELSRFQFGHVNGKTLLVAASQSGKSMEVVELVEKARPIAPVAGIYNTEGCPLSSLAEFPLPIRAGQERSITSKTYENTMLILNVLAHALLGKLDGAFWEELSSVADWSAKWLAHWEENARPLYDFAQGTVLFDLLANNASLATARQLSLAYREGLHNCTAVWECADYAHGQYHSSKLGAGYLAQMFFPAFAEGTKEMKMLNYILEHGGRVMLYTASDIPAREGLMVVKLPRVRESLMPLVESVAAETLLGMLFGPAWVKDH